MTSTNVVRFPVPDVPPAERGGRAFPYDPRSALLDVAQGAEALGRMQERARIIKKLETLHRLTAAADHQLVIENVLELVRSGVV